MSLPVLKGKLKVIQGQHNLRCNAKDKVQGIVSTRPHISCLERVRVALTFVEALLTVHDGNPVSSETGGPVELTVVLVQLPI